MPALPLTAPASTPGDAPGDALTLLRTLHLAPLPGALLLHEGSRTFLAVSPDDTLRLPADAPPARLRDTLARLLDADDNALWALALTYEAGRALLPIGQHIMAAPELPSLLAHRYRAWAVLEKGRLHIEGAPAAREELADRLSAPTTVAPPIGRPRAPLTRDLDDQAYAGRFETIQAALRAGDYYQLDLTCAHRGRWSGDPLALFERLCGPGETGQGEALPARAAYLDAGDLVLASASPELLLDYDPETRLAISGPIKGTAAAPRSNTERRRLAGILANDPKERAEHVMIVDLVRNDLGRVCLPGTVRPRKLFAPLRSGPVQHLLTEVEGELSRARKASELFLSLFPGGSITGAPKIAAMRAIDRLELAPRGFYCGALGRVGPHGALSFTLPIRTATLTLQGERKATDSCWRLSYGTGGGIVEGASMAQELAELELKAARLRQALS